jgi:hypothetical protein
MATKAKWFSVNRTVFIQGARKVPSVCYPLSDSLAASVEEMVEGGLARIWDTEVRFVSGEALPLRKVVVRNSVQMVPNTTKTVVVKKGKTRRDFD